MGIVSDGQEFVHSLQEKSVWQPSTRSVSFQLHREPLACSERLGSVFPQLTVRSNWALSPLVQALLQTFAQQPALEAIAHSAHGG